MSQGTQRRDALPQDPSGAVYTITKEHRDTHAGKVFSLRLEQASVGTGGYNYLIRVGAKQCHFSYGAVMRSDGIIMRFFEGSVVSANGSDLTPINDNRDLAGHVAVPVTLFSGAPTITTAGDQIDVKYAASGAVGNSGGGVVNLEYQWVLKRNTNYILRVAPAAGTHTAYTEMKFYEVAVKG